MNANDTSPCGGNEGSDRAYNYEAVAQTLLQQQLEIRGYAVRKRFVDLAGKIERGDDLDQSDVRELREALRQAQYLVDVIEEGTREEER